ncbi:hypothetical protein PbJCM13498_04440 [Prolixibacter bellariivorans]|uniref:Transposase IS200-like domain-containing protein n=2 Tax=Prolixibacter bellariivorans TaxID=314319 RepID=A0A5M4AVK1_9BACT|nr:hypothetical protein PbJCM13498_04440 [Prolixibacter bellariivorans]
MYFVTICTSGKRCYLGHYHNPEQLFPTGILARNYWLEIPNHFPFVKLDAFVIMPNHVHGIVIIDKPESNVKPLQSRDAINRVSTGLHTVNTADRTGGATRSHNPMLHDNLSRIIRWYKGRVTFEIRKTNPQFAWQSRFHDHIIRDREEYHGTRQYIIDNPQQWMKDPLREAFKS